MTRIGSFQHSLAFVGATVMTLAILAYSTAIPFA